jgi:nucleoside-diphosphate-sugar epimerase
MKWTIFGASGFIGTYLVSYLRQKDAQVDVIGRGSDIDKKNLGHVIYCAGTTADFRTRPFDTIEAHVSLPSRLMEKANFDSFLYLSSTRVYQRCASTLESTEIVVLPEDYSDLYNISKIMGESICLNSGRKAVRIARLSNILGFFPKNRNFVDCLLEEALTSGQINLQSAPTSAKDYLFIDDVVAVLEKICLSGEQRIYNVASGVNLTNERIIDMIKNKIACQVHFSKNVPTITFPLINNKRLVDEFAFLPSEFQSNLYGWIEKLSLMVLK